MLWLGRPRRSDLSAIPTRIKPKSASPLFESHPVPNPIRGPYAGSLYPGNGFGVAMTRSSKEWLKSRGPGVLYARAHPRTLETGAVVGGGRSQSDAVANDRVEQEAR